MATVSTPAATIVARDTARLAPLFRALLADPAVCPQRALAAAALMWDVERTRDGRWLCPASNGKDAYQLDPTGKVCSCPDHQTRGVWCKHGIGVWLALQWERAEAEAGQPADPGAEIPYVLTSRALAVLDPDAACTACDDPARWHDGDQGQCTRSGVDADGLYWCDCAGFATDDDAA